MNFIELKPGITVAEEAIPVYKTDIKGTKEHIYILGGVHGDEVEGVYIAEQLLAHLKESDDFNSSFIIIPNLNIDGYRTGTRCNSHGIDLNRNFNTSTWKKGYKEKRYFPGEEPESEPEIKFLLKLFAKYPPKFIISLHTWKPFVNYNGNGKEIAELIAEHNEYDIIAGEIEKHPTPGSLGDYCEETLNCPLITLECPELTDDKGLKAIWEENKKGLIEALKKIDVQ